MRSPRGVVTIPQIQLGDRSSGESNLAPEHIQAALEASCDALLTLQLMSAAAGEGADSAGGVGPQLSQAIESLRLAIAELRCAWREDAGALTLGFVVGASRGFKRPDRRQSVKTAPDGKDRGLDAAC